MCFEVFAVISCPTAVSHAACGGGWYTSSTKRMADAVQSLWLSEHIEPVYILHAGLFVDCNFLYIFPPPGF